MGVRIFRKRIDTFSITPNRWRNVMVLPNVPPKERNSQCDKQRLTFYRLFCHLTLTSSACLRVSMIMKSFESKVFESLRHGQPS